jgi:hypothetical protein
VPDLDYLRKHVPTGGSALLEQALYEVRGRTTYTRIAMFYAVTEDVARARLLHVGKASVDINSAEGAQHYVDAMRAQLLAAVNAQTTQGLNAALLALRQFKGELTPQAQQMVAEQMGSNYQRAMKDIENSPAIMLALRGGGVEAIQAAKQSTIKDMGMQNAISSQPNAQDKAMVDHMADNTGLFVRDQYGAKRAGYVTDKAKQIMSSSLDQNLGREDMAQQMKVELGGGLGRKDDAYWTTVADNSITRARSWGNMSSMHDAGFEYFKIEAVLDEVTSKTCRFLHGKELSLPAALNTAFQGSFVGGPEQLDAVNPFVTEHTDKVTGVTNLTVPIYEGAAPGQTPKLRGAMTIGSSSNTGMGQLDQAGSWEGLTEADIQSLNIGAPPYHHRCRSTIIPTGKPAQARVVPGMKVPPPPPPSKKPKAPKGVQPGKAYKMKAPEYDAKAPADRVPDETIDKYGAYWDKRMPAEEADFNAALSSAGASGLDPVVAADFKRIAFDFVKGTGRKKDLFAKPKFPRDDGPGAKLGTTNSIANVAPGQRGAMEEVQAEIGSMADRATMGGKKIQTNWYKENKQGGANYSWDRDQKSIQPHSVSVNCDTPRAEYFKTNYAGTVAHELGHSMQVASPQLRALQQTIMKRRIAKYPDFVEIYTEKPHPYPGRPPIKFLVRREYPDKLVDSYAGAEYGPFAAGVEFASVAMDWFYTRPVLLYSMDKEMFLFITSVLRGLV